MPTDRPESHIRSSRLPGADPTHAPGRKWARRLGRAAGLLSLAIAAGGCTTPILRSSESELQRTVVDMVRREMADARSQPADLVTTRSGSVDDLKIPPNFMEELARMSGPGAYNAADPTQVPLGLDLLGRQPRTVSVSLERAIHSAVEHNLAFRFATLAPAISQSQVVQAEAAFDWVLFASVERSWLQDQNLSTGSALSRNDREVIATIAGLRRNLPTGAAFTIQQETTYTRARQNGTTPRDSQSNGINWSFQYDQPLMRGFGADVALAQVRLARNAERTQIAQLEGQLLELVTNVERNYWTLWQAYHDVMILQRLLDRGGDAARRMEAQPFRTNPANIANTRARVAEREANLLRAQNVLRRQSDALKALMNDPQIPAASELLVIPVDRPVDESISYNLGEALFTAIERRPEVAQSILSLDDTGIRQLVAANNRLPMLDLRFQARSNALDRDLDDAYSVVSRGEFGSWVLGLFFEQPIGNRDAEALYVRRRLERSQAVISYQNTVQAIAVEVKNALDNLGTNYQLIIRTQVARVAAAEALRSLVVQREINTDVTPERLDLELGRQEALANAERAEIQSLVDYNVAVAEWYAAQGTALDRNRIKFEVPSVEEALHWPYLPPESADYARRWWAQHTQTSETPGEPSQEPVAEPRAEPGTPSTPTGEPTGQGVTPPAPPEASPAVPAVQNPGEQPAMFPIQPAPPPGSTGPGGA